MSSLHRHRRRRAASLASVAALALGGVTLAANADAAPTPAAEASGCTAVVTTQVWVGGFTTNVTVDASAGQHTLAVTLKDTSQRVTQAWGGSALQSGSLVTAAVDAPLGTATLGLAGRYAGLNGASPTTVTLDGATCATSTSTVGTVRAQATKKKTTPVKITVKSTKCVTKTKNGKTRKSCKVITKVVKSSNGNNNTKTTKTTTTKTTAPETTTPITTSTKPTPTGTTPVAINGLLHVCGTNLCNQYDKPIQLRGMSTHGLQWFWQCYNDASLNALANDWKADLLRIAMYVQEKGYETNPSMFTDRVNTLVDMAEARGMYALIDFHTLSPGDPNYNTDRAKTFFQAVSSRNKDKTNVIYEIANEPNGVSWSGIKQYADQVIPVIRANDPDAVIIVGTPGWSSLGVSGGGSWQDVVNSPISASNVMYTFHFYAASHGDNYRSALSSAAARLPMFVTEFGTVSYTGDGSPDLNATTTWLNLLDQYKISYANWTYSDHEETSAVFRAGTCYGSDYSSDSVLKDSGRYMKNRISSADYFPVG